MIARKVTLAFVIVMLLSLGGYGFFKYERITDKASGLENQNSELNSSLNRVIYENSKFKKHLDREHAFVQDLDGQVLAIYDAADYLAHLEVTIKMKGDKTIEDLIEKMSGYPVIIYQDNEDSQDPENPPQDPPPEKEKTATVVLCGSLFKDSGQYYILTAGHIRDNKYTIEKIDASFKNGQSGEFKLLGYDSKLDAALLKPKDGDFEFNGRLATLGTSADLKIQQTVVHLGSPLILPNTCSRGAINNLSIGNAYPSKTNQSLTQARLVMHDAKIDAGSSGGPLLNLRGEVVGINVMVFRRYNVWSLSVPIDDIKAVLDDLKNGIQR